MHPTLLIGPADWQPERMPKAEFLRRIEALWQRCPTASHALVAGDSRHHAELAYLTNLVPKLEPAVALVSRHDAPRLFVGGGANMLGAARPLTWIADVVPLKELERVRLSDCVLIGSGYLAADHHQAIIDAAGAGEATPDATAQLWALMGHKSPIELAAIRESCIALHGAMASIVDAKGRGLGITAAVLEGERAANAHDAQDVRTLFSVNGGRTLVPFGETIARAIDPLQVYVAVRRFNYWAEGFAMLSQHPSAAAAQAGSLLRTALAAIKPGTRTDAIVRMVEAVAAPFRLHPMTTGFANAIGLALEEPPHIDVGATFTDGEVYSLKVGLTDGSTQHAIASAMIAVRQGRNDVLWTID
jgi:hypothetical protein